jgi:hypothetical protein
MSTEYAPQVSRIEVAVNELQEAIRARYPAASFAVEHGDDPEGTYLYATVEADDTDKVIDVFIDRLLELQVDEGLPVYVIPVRPAERIATVP